MNNQASIDQLFHKLENDAISDREKADILTKIIDIESSKPEKDADMELIQECIEFFNVLTNSENEIKMHESQLPARLQQIYQKAADANTFANTCLSQSRPFSRKRRSRSLGIAAASFAAIVLIVATSLTVIARINGYGNMWEWVSVHLNEIFHINSGDDGSIDGITVVLGNETTTYSDVESWLRKEDIDILYPSVLPDDVKLERILQSNYGEDEMDIIWVFNTPDVRFTVQNYALSNFELLDNAEIVEASGYRFNILYHSDVGHQAFCIIGNYAYSIECTDRESLFTILNHLKGIQK